MRCTARRSTIWSRDANAFNSSVERSAANDNSFFSLLLYAGTSIGILLIGLGTLWILRSVVRPLRRMTGTMAALASGDLATIVPATARRDEIGAMANAVETFKTNAIEQRRLEHDTETARHLTDDERARNEAIRAGAAREQADVVASLAGGIERLSNGDLMVRLERPFRPSMKSCAGTSMGWW